MIDLLLGVLCEVRAEAHYEAHGGLLADSAWHVTHGERPTCSQKGSQQSSSSSSQSDDFPDRRDHAGFNCTWHGCG